MALPGADMDIADRMSGTPAGYTTPEQLQLMRQYAKALLAGSDKKEIWTSPGRGWGDIVSSLMGGYLANRAGRNEAWMNADFAQRLAEERAAQEAAGRRGMADELPAAPEPFVKPAMRDDVPKEPEEVPGRALSFSDVMKDTEAKAAAIRAGAPDWSMVTSRTPVRTASLGGAPTPDSTAAGSPAAPVGPVGGRMFGNMAGAGWAPGETPSGFAGPGATPAAAQTAEVLARGGATPAAPAVRPGATQPGLPGVGPPPYGMPDARGMVSFPPGFIPQRPQISTQNFRAIMGNPFAPQQLKDAVWQQYYMQHQPVQLGAPFGSYLMHPGGNTGIWMPAPMDWNYKAGGVEQPGRALPLGPYGPIQKVPTVRPPGQPNQVLPPNVPPEDVPSLDDVPSMMR